MFPSLRREEADRRRGRLRAEPPLFTSPGPPRPLIAILDVDTCPLAREDDLIAGFLQHDDVRCWRYSDHGPPASAPRRSDDVLGTHVDGWLTLTASGEADWEVTYAADEAVHSSGVGLHGDELGLVPWDRKRLGQYDSLSNDDAKNRMRGDLLAIRAADAADADVLVTTRPYLLNPQRGLASTCGTTPLTPDDALAIVTLFLRRFGTYAYSWRPDRRHTATAPHWYRDAALAAIPNLGSWLHAVREHEYATSSQYLAHLGQTALDRLVRMLRARDDIHEALLRPVSSDANQAAVSALDDLTVAVQAALDATARVCVAALDLDVHRTGRAWHRRGLRAALAEAPGGQALLALTTDSPGSQLLTVVAGLRNTVHGAGMLGRGFRDATSGDVGTVAIVPPDAVEQIEPAVENLGGKNSWGLHPFGTDHLVLEPGPLVETLTHHFVRFLDDLLGLMVEDVLAAPRGALPESFTVNDEERAQLLAQLCIGSTDSAGGTSGK